MSQVLRAAAALLAVSLIGGCAKTGRQMVPVHGAVTFQGKPVTEGTVQFNDPTNGDAPSADLKPDGTYAMTVPEGHYTVSILPVLVNTGGDGVPNLVYKTTAGIPAKYRDGTKSGLTADVSPTATQFDFALTK
jgi:hypothetical protein